MHANANIIYQRQEGERLIKTVLDVQPRTNTSGDQEEESEDQKITNLIS